MKPIDFGDQWSKSQKNVWVHGDAMICVAFDLVCTCTNFENYFHELDKNKQFKWFGSNYY